MALTYYFAYGSNLNAGQMQRRVGIRPSYFRVSLANYRLTFDSRGKANIVEENGAKVYGAVCLLNDEQMERLDGYEGVPRVYKRVTAKTVVDEIGGEMDAVTYVRTENTQFKAPDSAYLKLILDGLSDLGYPESVISEVRATADGSV